MTDPISEEKEIKVANSDNATVKKKSAFLMLTCLYHALLCIFTLAHVYSSLMCK